MHIAVSRSLFDEALRTWPPELAESRAWIVHQAAFPVIDCEFTRTGRTPLRLVCDFTDWDDQPPSISIRNSSGEVLSTLLPNTTAVFNGSPHPITGRPFVCMAGTKEFHSHSSHLNESWEQYRGKPGFGLGDILTKLWNAWLKGSG